MTTRGRKQEDGVFTTTELINYAGTWDPLQTIESTGFTTAGVGAGLWVLNGITGQTPSQSPAQLGDALLNDANGNQWSLFSDDSINVESLGANGDGSTDDTQAFQAAINAAIRTKGKVVLKNKTFSITKVFISGADGLIIEGENSTITTDGQIAIEFSTDGSNVKFKELNITSTETSTSGTFGLIHCLKKNLTKIKVLDCSFSCPTSNTNAIKFFNSTDLIHDDIEISGCTFENIGQIAIEINAHVHDGVPRYRNIRVNNNKFSKLGLVGNFGQAISFSGVGENCVVSDNTIQDAFDIGIEYIGLLNSVIANNTINNMDVDGTGIFVSDAVNNNRHKNISVLGNNVLGTAAFCIQTGPGDDMAISGNNFSGNGAISIESITILGMSGNSCNVANKILFQDCDRITASGNSFFTNIDNVTDRPAFNNVTRSNFSGCRFEARNGNSIGMFIDNGSADNVFVGCTFSNEQAIGGGTVLQFNGAGTTGNQVVGCKFQKNVTSGFTWANTGGATNNQILAPSSNLFFNPQSGENFAHEISGATSSSGFLNSTLLNGTHLWVDSADKLRIKSSVPTSDTDGTVVGTQT